MFRFLGVYLLNLRYWRVIRVLVLLFLLFLVFYIFIFWAFAQEPPPPPPPPEPVEGWLWSSGFGWISLSSKNCEKLNQENPGVCQTAGIEYGLLLEQEGILYGTAWSENAGWFCFGITCSEAGWPAAAASPPSGILEARINQATGEISGWAYSLNAGWVHLRGQIQGGSNYYGYSLNLDTKKIENFAWNANADDSGLGWVKGYGGLEISPWLETVFGDVYTQKEIIGSTPAPFSEYNATYLIQTGEAGQTITNFAALCAEIDDPELCGRREPRWVSKGAGVLAFPEKTKKFTTPLGRVDFDGIFAGQYGKTAVYPAGSISSADALGAQPVLAGKIHIFTGDSSIDQAMVFQNGSGWNKGSGLVVINGNFNINADTSYGTGAIQEINQLASAGFIVLGDIVISPSVRNLAGAYLALGNGGVSCQDQLPGSGCGIIATGQGTAALTVRGLLMARKFGFERQARIADRGSELVIYDGRLLASPPPGMEDLAKGLPAFRLAAP